VNTGTLDERRAWVRRRLVTALRSNVLVAGGRRAPWPEVAESIGASRSALLALFPHEDDLLDALNDDLVAEASARLHTVALAASATGDASPAEVMRSLVQAVVRSRPLDRSGLLARLERRARGLRGSHADLSATDAERRFLVVLQHEIELLVGAVGREFTLPAPIACRAILNSYERAFEAWLLEGREESEFPASSFAIDALPALVLALSRPAPSVSPKE
jgi:AcrR family transcriptional regulator